MTDKNPLAHYSGVLSEAVQESAAATETAAPPAPKLDEAWKARMLDGQPLQRDKDGIGYHPALPDFDEGVKCSDLFAALGIELKAGMAENEMDSDAYEAMTENGLTDDGDNYNAWTPKRPEGDGWNLVAVFDTEDGPACWWMRDMPFVPQRAEGYRERVDNAAVEVLSMNMKAKLAGQRAKGYRGWNNDCTQQRLSDLLRECVEKGDPVDVANFCAFLLSRGETIAPQAAPAAVAAAAPVVPSGWVPCVVTHEGQHPEEVAYGPQAMMDRLKKWLERYFKLKAAARVVLPEPAATIYTIEAVVPGGTVKHHAQVHKALPAGTTLFAEPEVRALLAGVSAPAAQAVEVDDQMALAFHHAITDGSIGQDDLDEIKIGLRAVLVNVHAPKAQADARDAEIQRAVLKERERICAAIKAEDDHCAMGDYMLDSDDCIKVARGEWVRPVYEPAIATQTAQQGGAA